MQFSRLVVKLMTTALVAVAFAAGPLSAQEGTVVGQVTEVGTLRPLESAQVSIAGENLGGLTNAAGRFVLVGVPVGTHEIDIRFVGYATATQQVTVTAGETVVVEVALQSQAISLDELIVTGTGVVTERRRLGQTVESLTSDMIDAAPVSSITEALSGRVTGMLPSVGTGVGTSPMIILRGVASLSQRNAPLIYIDGVRVDNTYSKVGSSRQGTSLDRLNPYDIERMEIIKGAAAATLYGTEASSGVIQIITKRGVSGAPQWTVGLGGEGTKVPQGRVKTSAGYDFANKVLLDGGKPALDYVGGWGSAQDYSASVRGGTETVQYFASGRLRDEVGNMGRAYRDYQGVLDANLRMGLNFQATDDLEFRVDVNTVRSDRRAPSDNGLRWGSGYLWGFWLGTPRNPSADFPYGGRYSVNAYEIAWPPPHGYSGVLPDAEHRLPLDSEILTSSAARQDENRLTLSGAVAYDWGHGINSELILGRDRVAEEYIEQLSKGLNISVPEGSRTIRTAERKQTTVDFKTSWQYEVNPNVSSTLVVGGQSFWEEEWIRSFGAKDFAVNQLSTLPAGSVVRSPNEYFREVINAGVYAQQEVGLWDRLFLNAGVRVDGNSSFGENFSFQVYPKGGASWVLSDHDFWDFDTFDQFRLRAALGAAGQQPGAFDATQTWVPGVGVDNLSILRPGNPGNPDLKPERTFEWEIGADMGFVGGRVGLDVVYYNSRTTDALLPVPSASSLGFSQPSIQNIGEIATQGVEASLDVTWLQSRNLRWSTTFSAALNDSEVVDLGGIPDYRIDIAGGASLRRYYTTMAEGHSPGAWIAPVKDPNNPYTVSVPIDQLTRLNQITPNKLKNSAGGDSLAYQGRPLPLWTGSFLTAVDIGGVRINAMFTGGLDYHMFSEVSLIQDAASRTSHRVAIMEAALDNPNTTTAERQAIVEDFGNKHPSHIPDYLVSSDFLRFADLSVSFNIPEEMISGIGGMTSLGVRLSANNLFLWNKCGNCMSDPLTPYHGVPDARSGGPNSAFGMNSDYGQLPTPRRFGIRLQAGF